MNALGTVARRELAGFFATPAAFLFRRLPGGHPVHRLLGGDLFQPQHRRCAAHVRVAAAHPHLPVGGDHHARLVRGAPGRHPEPLLTAPVGLPALVGGKFLACLALVAIAARRLLVTVDDRDEAQAMLAELAGVTGVERLPAAPAGPVSLLPAPVLPRSWRRRRPRPWPGPA